MKGKKEGRKGVKELLICQRGGRDDRMGLGGREINTWEGIRGNNKSTEVRTTCRWISTVITTEHMQHSHTNMAAMTVVFTCAQSCTGMNDWEKKTITL
jgi:hypothetical protein